MGIKLMSADENQQSGLNTETIKVLKISVVLKNERYAVHR